MAQHFKYETYFVGISWNINVMNRFATETLRSGQVLTEAARIRQKLHKCAQWVYKSFKPRQTGRNIRSLAAAAVSCFCFFCSFISFSFVFSQKNKIFFLYIYVSLTYLFLIHIQLYHYVHNYLQSLGIQYDKREQKGYLIITYLRIFNMC